MSNVNLRERYRDEGLLPFQVDFIERFLASDSPRHWQLIAPVGTGKTHLTLTLIRQLYEANREARVLVVVPPAMIRQWRERISSASKPTGTIQLLDRAALVELASQADKLPWP